MQKIRSAALVVNAQSRKGRKLFREARALAAKLDFPVQCFEVRKPAKLDETVRRALSDKPDMLILGGGDGTISGLVDHIVGRDIALGVLPLGTANSFARTLEIPLTLEGAMAVIGAGHLRRIDLGMIDGDYFANCAAMGLSPLIAATVPHKLKRTLGRLGYLIWAAWKFVQFKPFTLIVDDGNGEKRLNVVEVRISNGPYHGGTELVDDAAVDSGEIVVQAVTGHLKRRLIWNWVASAFRLEARKETVENFYGRSLKISTEPPLAISIDGEVLARTPVTAKIAADVIWVAAPPASRDSA
ncbi:diacylglycerol/lipid kinase family protein [Sphingomonas sp. C3-2]|uniref:diacylglycerol/lipid kinase family protein n=1 Tax=Sphingomonas sp. C3-2 TaxID=3062169 RepID=UPI00294AC3BB|nr:diacylglycerol kinase family protein [Sphingomonas sp. C3-2]WOK36568.1 diacylglycerol kinase family protein [Sphingomonas sp. C3-2]